MTYPLVSAHSGECEYRFCGTKFQVLKFNKTVQDLYGGEVREICTDAFDALTMQHRGGALHFCAQRMSSRQLGPCVAHEKLLHPAGCRRAGGRARTAGGAGEPAVVRGGPGRF